MFSFFRKKKKKEYSITKKELDFFKNLITILPNKYHYLLPQINDNFLIAFKENVLGFKDSYTFLLNAKLEPIYINKKLPHFFILKGISIWNSIENKFYGIELDILSGYLGGFNIENIEFSNFDFSKFDISEINEKHFENKDLEKLLKGFNDDEKILIKENIEYTYEIKLKEGKFYFFDDLFDGDVIALDNLWNVYILAHDPFIVKNIFSKMEFIEILKKGNFKDEVLKKYNIF
jgi:hypothetical protein